MMLGVTSHNRINRLTIQPPALLSVSRIVQQEAHCLFYERNNFCFEIATLKPKAMRTFRRLAGRSARRIESVGTCYSITREVERMGVITFTMYADLSRTATEIEATKIRYDFEAQTAAGQAGFTQLLAVYEACDMVQESVAYWNAGRIYQDRSRNAYARRDLFHFVRYLSRYLKHESRDDGLLRRCADCGGLAPF